MGGVKSHVELHLSKLTPLASPIFPSNAKPNPTWIWHQPENWHQLPNAKVVFWSSKKINLLVFFFFFIDHESGFDIIIGEENAVGVNCHMAHISLKKYLTRCLFFFQPSKPKFLRY